MATIRQTIENGDIQRGIQLAKQIIDSEKDYGEAYFVIAYCYLLIKDIDKCISHLQGGFFLEPERFNPPYQNELIRMIRENHLFEASRSLSNSLKIKSSLPVQNSIENRIIPGEEKLPSRKGINKFPDLKNIKNESKKNKFQRSEYKPIVETKFFHIKNLIYPIDIPETDLLSLESEYTKSIKEKRNNTNELYFRACIFYLLGKKEKALEDLRSIINKLNTHERALRLRAWIFLNFNRKLDARKDLNELLKQKNKTWADHLFRAITYYQEKKYDNALVDLNSSIIMQNNAENLFYRGKIFLLQKKYDLALKDFNLSINFEDNQPFVHYYKGLISLQKKQSPHIHFSNTLYHIYSPSKLSYYFPPSINNHALFFEVFVKFDLRKEKNKFISILDLSPETIFFISKKYEILPEIEEYISILWNKKTGHEKINSTLKIINQKLKDSFNPFLSFILARYFFDFSKKKLDFALKLFEQTISEGIFESLWYAGKISEKLYSSEVALTYYTKGKEIKNNKCLYEWGINKIIKQININDGLECVLLSAEKGYLPAIIASGDFYLKGIDTVLIKNEIKAMEYFIQGAYKGHVGAMYNAGVLMLQYKKNINQALKWIVLSALENVPHSFHALGVLFYRHGLIDEAITAFDISSKMGLPQSSYMLSRIFETGSGIKKDKEYSNVMFNDALKANYPPAIFLDSLKTLSSSDKADEKVKEKLLAISQNENSIGRHSKRILKKIFS